LLDYSRLEYDEEQKLLCDFARHFRAKMLSTVRRNKSNICVLHYLNVATLQDLGGIST
jgi:hypothetical protein